MGVSEVGIPQFFFCTKEKTTAWLPIIITTSEASGFLMQCHDRCQRGGCRGHRWEELNREFVPSAPEVKPFDKLLTNKPASSEELWLYRSCFCYCGNPLIPSYFAPASPPILCPEIKFKEKREERSLPPTCCAMRDQNNFPSNATVEFLNPAQQKGIITRTPNHGAKCL